MTAGLLLAAVACNLAPRPAAPLADAGVDGDVSDGAAVTPPACADDRFGRGTADLPATTLPEGLTDALVVCPPTVDWFALDLPVGRPFAVRVQANRAVRLRVGDLMSAPGRRPALRGRVAPGGVVVGVEAVDSAAVVRYALSASVSVADCADANEPDDTPAMARALVANAEGVVCEGDADLFVVEGAPGARVRVEVAAIEGQGTILAAVADFDGRAVDIEQAERSITRRLDAEGRALFAIRPLGSGGRYRVSAQVTPVDAEIEAFAGVVRVPDRAVTAEGVSPPVHAPVAGVVVDAVVDGELAAVARTDADGAWAMAVAAPADADVVVRARASLWDDPRLFSVGPTVGQAWAEPIDAVADLSAESPLGRAAHVAQTLAGGLRALTAYLPLLRTPPAIRVRWTPGGAAPCGTCYQPATDHIELSGRLTDPDEWDDAIILHELAHHVAARYGRDDSPGGAHDGSPVAPALAWSEGFATATAAWLSGPMVFDSRATGVRQLDLELMDDPRAFGTVNGQPDGAISEYLVAALLWDLLDAPDADDDAEQVAPTAFFEAALNGLALRSIDVGAPGADLLDHAEELACRSPVDWPTLLESRGLDAPIVCRNKPGALLRPIHGGLRVGCAGWLARAGDVRWVEPGARVPSDAIARLDCGAIIEHFDPRSASEASAALAWRVVAGAAEPVSR